MDAAENTAIVWQDTAVTEIHENITLLSAPQDDWGSQVQHLAEIRQLRDGWDGDDAVAPDPELVESAAQFLMDQRRRNLPAPTRIIPTPDGIIIIEWRSDGFLATLELSRPYEGDLLTQWAGYPSEFRTLSWNPSRLGVISVEEWVEEPELV